MKNVTPTKVLPDWAICELGQVAREYGLKITVRQVMHDWPQLEVVVECGESNSHFLVSMRDDWEDLRILGEGDLWDIVENRYVECINA